jgi:hypothetical protein
MFMSWEMSGVRVGEDLLRGLRQIGIELDLTPRQVRYGADQGYYSVVKLGGRWIASRRQLRKEHRQRTSGQPTTTTTNTPKEKSAPSGQGEMRAQRALP